MDKFNAPSEPSFRGKAVLLDVAKPYDFTLSLKAVRSFAPVLPEQNNTLVLATKINGTPTLIRIRPKPGSKYTLEAYSTPQTDNSRLQAVVEWVLFAELDLTPFYRLIAKDPRLASITYRLRGLKPMRPVSLFEMAVIAITEQQISLAAAYRIRSRIIQRFGESIDNQWIFPEPNMLARATLEDLHSLGLSRQKTQYIHELATKIANGILDLEILKTMDDDEAKKMITDLRGFGKWSADYILVRGLARPDSVPIDDLAIRSVVGEYLGNGRRISSQEVAEKLEPFRPYRGLLAFYLLVKYRLDKPEDQPQP